MSKRIIMIFLGPVLKEEIKKAWGASNGNTTRRLTRVIKMPKKIQRVKRPMKPSDDNLGRAMTSSHEGVKVKVLKAGGAGAGDFGGRRYL